MGGMTLAFQMFDHRLPSRSIMPGTRHENKGRHGHAPFDNDEICTANAHGGCRWSQSLEDLGTIPNNSSIFHISHPPQREESKTLLTTWCPSFLVYASSRYLSSACSNGVSWAATHSQIYPALHKLQEQQLVTSENHVRGQLMQRIVYTITD